MNKEICKAIAIQISEKNFNVQYETDEGSYGSERIKIELSTKNYDCTLDFEITIMDKMYSGFQLESVEAFSFYVWDKEGVDMEFTTTNEELFNNLTIFK